MEDANNFYNKDLKKFARINRRNPTNAEKYLWDCLLKSRQLNGYQFFRQRPIDDYIVDFFCKELQLIIEADGITHENKEREDLERQEGLIELGYFVMRFTDEEVLGDIQFVEKKLMHWINEYEKEHPEVVKFKERKKRVKS